MNNDQQSLNLPLGQSIDIDLSVIGHAQEVIRTDVKQVGNLNQNIIWWEMYTCLVGTDH